jgi:hypothetical protein
MTGTSMILRMTAAAVLAMAATLTASAQRGRQAQDAPRLPFPAEKFSPRPVQSKENSKPALLPTASEKEQRQRWEERSRNPSAEPR